MAAGSTVSSARPTGAHTSRCHRQGSCEDKRQCASRVLHDESLPPSAGYSRVFVISTAYAATVRRLLNIGAAAVNRSPHAHLADGRQPGERRGSAVSFAGDFGSADCGAASCWNSVGLRAAIDFAMNWPRSHGSVALNGQQRTNPITNNGRWNADELNRERTSGPPRPGKLISHFPDMCR